MKKIVLSLIAASMISAYLSPTYASASELSNVESIEINSQEGTTLGNDSQTGELAENDNIEKYNNVSDSQNYTIEYDEDGPVVVVYEEGYGEKQDEESMTTATVTTPRPKGTYVSKWGKWQYTHIAISTGVLTNSINSALYGGVILVAGTIGLPVVAVSGLLEAARWTKLGNAPGKAVAKIWDTSGNGWVGFYMSKGYNGAGKHVATRYKTK
ncbi:hypothetical protein ACEN4P_01245 [Marinilactibacillus psychrotolerans]|uniref:hypothetical protein n=1 Tax=Marinilactibacillus psychrotolerans TaxID=191770 RepID=UPI001C7D2BFA|nr:hypothetical protein [Marinilactibacillus psychrotolerans]GEQ33337.1 hypothetical protein B795N_12190 [Marinilactibacillus psychrotolerans]